MIRVVNLMIELSSTVNLRWRRQISYEPDVSCPVYILEKNQNVNRMGCHPVHIFIWKCKSDGPHPVYILKKIVNWMGGIRFSIFLKKKRQKVLLVIFTRTLLIFSKLMEVQDEGIEVQKESVNRLTWLSSTQPSLTWT